MDDIAELCNKIHEIYPQIGKCDIHLKVAWSEDRNARAVDFKKGMHRRRHYLEDKDPGQCMDRKQCVNLGIEFGQSFKNYYAVCSRQNRHSKNVDNPTKF